MKKEHKAVILAHNYQRGEVQDIADFVGDSLELSIQATKTKAKVVVFCGVDFMAETAAILNPDKIVLLPDREAQCPMAKMITAERLRELKRKHPKAKVVCYVNTSAAVKAESDICCTSANGEKVIASLADDGSCLPAEVRRSRTKAGRAFSHRLGVLSRLFPQKWHPPLSAGCWHFWGRPQGVPPLAKKVEKRTIIFVPDQYLGDYLAAKTGKKLILFPGFCPTHIKIRAEDVLKQKKKHPQALVLAHPECTRPVRELADKILGTGGMCRLASTSKKKEFIIATENGLVYRLKKENPKKIFYEGSSLAICPNMKKITLEKVLQSLEEMKFQVKVPEDVAKKARKAIVKMLSSNE